MNERGKRMLHEEDSSSSPPRDRHTFRETSVDFWVKKPSGPVQDLTQEGRIKRIEDLMSFIQKRLNTCQMQGRI